MTIETTVNKTIQSGNGSNKDFDFAFEIPDEDSLSLTKRGSDGTETAITTNFTVTGIGDEAGGTVNYPTSGSALGASEKIIIKRVVSLKQNENLRNQGDYSLEDIEDALDRSVMMCQQLQEQIDRSLKLPLTSSSTYVTVDDFVANKLLYVSSDGTKIKMSDADFGSIQTYLTALAAIAADISAVAAIDTEVTTVAGISADVTTVAGIDAEVIIVAGIAADVTQVSSIHAAVSTVSSINAAVSTVASISAAVSTVSGISANVSTVAGISSAVSTVSSISAAVSTVSGISAAVSTVASIASAVSSVNSNASNINTVAGIAAAVTSVAAIAADVSTVAAIDSDVTTVAGITASIASIITNLADIQNAASFNFPTLAVGDAGKFLKVNAGYNGYDLVASANLTALGGLTGAANKIPYFTGAGEMALTDVTIQATETGAGIAEIATQAETDTGTDDLRFVTPLKLKTNIDSRFVNSKVTNGYTYLPNGLILQWGFKAATGGTMTITFPIAFPNACLNAVSQLNATTQNYQSTAINTLATTQFTLYWDNAATGVYWQAIGY